MSPIGFEMLFPPGFVWGAATAAHQVEGSPAPSNWSAWEEQPGRIHAGDRVGRACDWWGGRYVEDFDRAAALGHTAHRFSIDWSRIEPEPGEFDDTALQFYAEMVAALRARGLEPLLTLHHFTHPLWLEHKGGWANRDVVQHFDEFVRVVVDALGDRVTMWCTLNEPVGFALQGYLLGRFPPGKHNLRSTFRVVEHLLRAHATAYTTIKELRPGAQIGFAKHQVSLIPRRPALLHLPARNLIRQVVNRAWVEALMTGVLRFPGYTAQVPEARGTFDWVGLNYYYRFVAGFNPLRPAQLFLEQATPREGIAGPSGSPSVGEIWPEGLFEQIEWLAERTHKPLYVTENGVPDPDDALRPLHLIRSLRSVWLAINFNYPVKGYFYWTLLDNFEWAEGYDPRYQFGLFRCDPVTQVRTPRRSAELYGAICAANALTSEHARAFLTPEQFDALFPGLPVKREIRLPARG